MIKQLIGFEQPIHTLTPARAGDTIGFLLNNNYEVVGHTWSLPSSNPVTRPDSWLNSLHNRLKRQTEQELVIGRLPAQP